MSTDRDGVFSELIELIEAGTGSVGAASNRRRLSTSCQRRMQFLRGCIAVHIPPEIQVDGSRVRT
jgi:hypothetical protein